MNGESPLAGGPPDNSQPQGIGASSREPSAVGGREITFTKASTVRPEPIRWLWDGRVPLGALTVLAGVQGLGKSTFTAWMTARVTRGGLDGDLKSAPAAVLIVTLEDHLASVVRPRLEAAGADLDLVEFVAVKFEGAHDLVTLPDDLLAVERGADDIGARLLVVDPIVATLAGTIDGYKDQHVRRALAPLASFAERLSLAVVGVMHLTKQQTGDVLSRVSGSVAFTAAPRSVLMFVNDPDDPEGEDGDQRLVVPVKGNWARLAASVAVRHETCFIAPAGDGDSIETGRLTVLGESPITKADLAAGGDPNERRGQLEEAADFLTNLLRDGAWHDRAAVERDGKAAGHSRSTLDRARRRLNIESNREGFPARASWRLPVASTVSDKDGWSNREAPENIGGSSDRPASRLNPADVRQLHELATDCVGPNAHSAHHHAHPLTGRLVCHACHPPADSLTDGRGRQ